MSLRIRLQTYHSKSFCVVPPGNEFLGRLGDPIHEVDLFQRREKIGEPGLAALALSAYPIAHEKPLVRRPLFLNALVVHVLAAFKRCADRIRARAFNAQIQMFEAWESR